MSPYRISCINFSFHYTELTFVSVFSLNFVREFSSLVHLGNPFFYFYVKRKFEVSSELYVEILVKSR